MKTIGKKLVIVLILFLAGGTMTSCHQQSSSVTNTMSTSQLLDKIKGGWAGQTIGVIFEYDFLESDLFAFYTLVCIYS